ncbi:MAG: hypothetical protein JOZ14_17290 [Acidobacteria bacterium]|nr:hypothetical protein [Acidobacteriota bacterium]
MTAPDFLRRHVFTNLGLKLISLVLAVGLWLAVSSSPPSEVILNVLLIFRNMPADLEISSQTVPGVQVRVRGPERIVRRLEPAELRAEIDVRGMKAGEHTFDLTKAVTVPDRLEVAEVVPSEVHVTFDTRARRRVPVHPRIVGSLPPGFAIQEIQAEPDWVEILGPRKEVDSVESAITDPIDVSGVLDRIAVMRPAYVSDPLIQVTNPQSLRITVIMKRER